MVTKTVKTYRYELSVLLAVLILAVVSIGLKDSHSQASTEKTAPPKFQQTVSNSPSDYPEVQELAAKHMEFDWYRDYFQALAKNKGGRYAYQVLKFAEFPSNIDLHLLGHVVGDVLYKQEGLQGITACNNDFRNACSHSIVTGLFFDKGDNALPEIAAACRQAPGGTGAYTMCFHGLGHGILAYEGFDMAKTATMCMLTGTKEKNNREGVECIGGSVMEIISGGGHDHDIWSKQRPKYLDPAHPLALCQSSFIPDIARPNCYEYLTPYLFEAAGANLNSPTPEFFKKAFSYCDSIPKTPAEGMDRDACYGGFGKEFDGIVQARDIRQSAINSMSNEKLQTIYQWCLLTPVKEGSAACIVHAMGSLYWGGENDRNVATRFCTLITDAYFQKTCVMNLIGSVSYYITDQNYRDSFCKDLPADYTDVCNERLKK